MSVNENVVRLSETTHEEMKRLTNDQKMRIVFGDYKDSGEKADVALLLGSSPDRMPERVRAAAKLYFDGRVRYIIPTGGVEWETDGKMISEACYMADMLKELGVPENAVVIENEARTTRENMICSLLTLQRLVGLAKLKSVMVVTSPDHLRRSTALARWLFPGNVQIYGFASSSDMTAKNNWFLSEASVAVIDNEIRLLKGLTNEGNIGDIEY